MKRHLRLMLLIGFILAPALGSASYLIEFKSGSKFATSHYWTTGNTVHFYSHGGVMGVPQSMIKRISTSDQAPKPEIRTQPVEQAKENKQEQTEEAPPEPIKTQETDIEALKKKKVALEEKLDETKRIYEQATESGSREEIQSALQEFLRYRDALVQYHKEILEQNNNELPKWW